MHYPVIVRAEAEDRYVARPLGLPELEAIASTEAEAIERVRQALDRWMTSAKLVEVDVATAVGRNPWLDTFGRSADDPDFEELQAMLARRQVDDAAAG